ncbi:MAG TPA: right-handed parallel beta-helix repeat-containing protein [Longilinea sp.]|nr:right-handed parallel beta-helix repeat-containing protein [Longilinea sp.]
MRTLRRPSLLNITVVLATVMAFFSPFPALAHAATLMVNSLADPGNGVCDGAECTLREAIAAAASGDTVTFDPALAGGTITLTATLKIDKDLILDGSVLKTPLVISGDKAVTVLYITYKSTVSIFNLDIVDGRCGRDCIAGGINNEGALSIKDSTIADNIATWGAGVYNAGTLTLTHVTLSNNQTANFDLTCAACGLGGGIFNSGALVIARSTFTGNLSTRNGGGGIYNKGNLSVTQTTFDGNDAAGYRDADHFVTGYGGGIYNVWRASISDSTFSNNNTYEPGNGSGIANLGTLKVVDSTFANNITRKLGAGIYNGPGGTLTAANDTFSGNVTYNGEYYGGGLYNERGTVYLFNTILANSDARSDCYNDSGFVYHAHNLIETNGDGSHACGPTRLAVDPMLGPLADNGGPTMTFALLSGSPAVDAGDDATCAKTDQRGTPRFQNGSCDSGAFELIEYTISGNAGMAGTFLVYLDGSPKVAAADENGNYSIVVGSDWSGRVTPVKPGYVFLPKSRSYIAAHSDWVNQDYRPAVISAQSRITAE